MQKKNYTPDGRVEITLSEESDWQLFDTIFNEITKKFDVELVKKLDGIDERYWDFKINNGFFCLHLQHFLGISIFPVTDPSLNDETIKIAKILDK